MLIQVHQISATASILVDYCKTVTGVNQQQILVQDHIVYNSFARDLRNRYYLRELGVPDSKVHLNLVEECTHEKMHLFWISSKNFPKWSRHSNITRIDL